MSISPELAHIISLMVAQTEMAQADGDVAAKATPAVQPPMTSVRASGLRSRREAGPVATRAEARASRR